MTATLISAPSRLINFMSLVRINPNPSHSQLRVFAVAWLLFIGAWGFVAFAKGFSLLAEGLWLIALGIPLIGLIFPCTLRITYLGLSYITFPIGFVVSHVVLALVYYFGFTFLGLIMRLFRYDPLTRRRDAKATTFWRERDQDRPPTSYFRQS